MFSIRFQNNELSPDRLAPFATETANNYDKIGSQTLKIGFYLSNGYMYYIKMCCKGD
jgi:hypothetical protein